MSAEVAAKYPLDALRLRKQEISDAVRQDLTTFFATRGLTITTVGMFGGMTYPQWWMAGGAGSGPGLLFQAPALPAAQH